MGKFLRNHLPCSLVVRRFLRHHSKFALWILCFYSVTFMVFLPALCNDLIYSKYYMNTLHKRELEESAMKLNAECANEAKQYLSKLSPDHLNKEKEKNQAVELAIGIITVPRQIKSQRLDYLTQTFVKTYQYMRQDSDSNFLSKALFICNVFAGPGNHSEAQRLNSFVDIHRRFPVNDPAAVIMDKFDKEKEDYAHCIDIALSYQPKYILMLEDDTVPHTNLFEVLKEIIDKDLRKKQDWAYLKLYYPERWKGFGFEVIPLLELTGIGILGGSVFVLCGVMCYNRKYDKVLERTQFLLGFVYLVLVTIMIGRQHFIEWRRISKSTYAVVPAPDCCSPAILYPADVASELSDYLKSFKCSATRPIDFAIDEFIRTKGHRKYLIEPNLMQHIGMLSSLKTWSDHPEEYIGRPT